MTDMWDSKVLYQIALKQVSLLFRDLRDVPITTSGFVLGEYR